MTKIYFQIAYFQIALLLCLLGGRVAEAQVSIKQIGNIDNGYAEFVKAPAGENIKAIVIDVRSPVKPDSSQHWAWLGRSYAADGNYHPIQIYDFENLTAHTPYILRLKFVANLTNGWVHPYFTAHQYSRTPNLPIGDRSSAISSFGNPGHTIVWDIHFTPRSSQERIQISSENVQNGYAFVDYVELLTQPVNPGPPQPIPQPVRPIPEPVQCQPAYVSLAIDRTSVGQTIIPLKREIRSQCGGGHLEQYEITRVEIISGPSANGWATLRVGGQLGPQARVNRRHVVIDNTLPNIPGPEAWQLILDGNHHVLNVRLHLREVFMQPPPPQPIGMSIFGRMETTPFSFQVRDVADLMSQCSSWYRSAMGETRVDDIEVSIESQPSIKLRNSRGQWTTPEAACGQVATVAVRHGLQQSGLFVVATLEAKYTLNLTGLNRNDIMKNCMDTYTNMGLTGQKVDDIIVSVNGDSEQVLRNGPSYWEDAFSVCQQIAGVVR